MCELQKYMCGTCLTKRSQHMSFWSTFGVFLTNYLPHLFCKKMFSISFCYFVEISLLHIVLCGLQNHFSREQHSSNHPNNRKMSSSGGIKFCFIKAQPNLETSQEKRPTRGKYQFCPLPHYMLPHQWSTHHMLWWGCGQLGNLEEVGKYFLIYLSG